MLGKNFLIAIVTIFVFNLSTINLDENITLVSKVYAETNEEIAFKLYSEGKQLMVDEDFEGAVEKFTEAIQLNPNNNEVYFERGYAYIKVGKYEESVADFTKCIEYNPENILAYKYRGYAYQEISKDKLSEADLEKAKADFDKADELTFNEAVQYGFRTTLYIVGGFCVIILLAVLGYFYYKRSKAKKN